MLQHLYAKYENQEVKKKCVFMYLFIHDQWKFLYT